MADRSQENRIDWGRDSNGLIIGCHLMCESHPCGFDIVTAFVSRYGFMSRVGCHNQRFIPESLTQMLPARPTTSQASSPRKSFSSLLYPITITKILCNLRIVAHLRLTGGKFGHFFIFKKIPQNSFFFLISFSIPHQKKDPPLNSLEAVPVFYLVGIRHLDFGK